MITPVLPLELGAIVRHTRGAAVADPPIDLIPCGPTEAAVRDRVNGLYAEIHFVPTGPTDHQLVAWQGGDVVGLGRLVAVDSTSQALELGGIWVAPAQRGRGLARAIVAKLIDTARDWWRVGTMGKTGRSAGTGPLELYCLPFAKLEAFYATFGFALADPRRAPAPLNAKLALCTRTYPEPVLLMRLER